MATRRQRLTLVVPNTGRSISDDGWQTVEPEFIKTWKSAVTCLRERRVVVAGDSYTVSIDWTGALRRHERLHAARRYLYKGGDKAFPDRILKARFPRRPSQNSITVATSQSKGSLSVVESVIHDVFLIMNIASPSCCDFHRASLLGDQNEPDISLSNVYFDSALQVFLTHGWPYVLFLDLDKVLAWFDSVRQGASQVPKNPMEKVLFALLHIAKIDTSPLVIIWLFYAFESLLQTRVGENFSSIVRRLCLLLDTDVAQSALVRKKMRELYEIRSAIVHGGFEVTHPMHNEQLDKRANDSFMRILDVTDYGYSFLLGAVQKTIVKGWKYPQFEEVIRAGI